LNKKIEEIKPILDQISPTFCVAKWRQLSLHLHSGKGGSCHHPSPHKISKIDLLERPDKLHNTPEKRAARNEMLNGKRPAECSYCWKFEDSEVGAFSDRHVKSSSQWATENWSEFVDSLTEEAIFPTYLEVSFSRTCNLKCVYCGPHFSTAWTREVEKFPQLKPFYKAWETEDEEENIFVKAFWLWWPELKKNLRVLRITGGEPLLSSSYEKLLDSLKQDKLPELSLKINSNLSHSISKINASFEVFSELKKNGHIKNVQIITSMESSGEVAEFIRYGHRQSQFWENLYSIFEIYDFGLSITMTLNSLCFRSIKPFLNNVIELKKKLRILKKEHLFFVDPSLLKLPSYFSIHNLPQEKRFEFIADLSMIFSDDVNDFFSDYEKMRFKSVIKNIESGLDKFDFLEYEKLKKMIEVIQSTRKKELPSELIALIN
jgi:organic radical activating enzyme